MKTTLLIILALLILPPVHALGIAPAKRELHFQPGVPQRYEITIVNNEKKDMDVVLSVDGVLQQYVKFDETKIKLTKEDDQKTVSYTVLLPDAIAPGSNNAKIIAEETVPNVRFGESIVVAKLSVVSILFVTVPYPEKFIDVNLDVTTTGDQVAVKAGVVNRGTSDIGTLEASFGLFDEDKKITAQSIKPISLKRDGSEELIAAFEKKEMTPGLYNAVATIGFDDKSLRLVKEFQIGTVSVLITNFDSYFVQNKINEFNIDVESAWNKELKNVFAEVFVFRNGKDVATFKGVSFDIKPLEKKRNVLYFNTNGLELGEYNAVVTLHYSKEIIRKEAKISIITKEEYEAKQSTESNATTYLVIALVVLVVALITLIIFLVCAMVFFTRQKK